jgi:hypothetical protein
MKLLEYLNIVDNKDGKALWMDFYRIAGNTANTDRWLKFMMDRRLISESIEQLDGKDERYYQKTSLGNIFHNMLKNRGLIGILTKELPKRKLRRAF